MEEILEMSSKKLERYRILLEINTKHISQVKCRLLNLSTRQVRNLLYEHRRQGLKGLVSKQRGKSSNRSYNPQFKRKVLDLIKEHYEDFGLTLISEKLQEIHQCGLGISQT